MEMKVINKKSTLELQQHEETLRAQLFALRIQSVLGKLERPHMIVNIRKDIARIKTELTMRIKNGEKIKPLPVNKMVLPEEKKEVKKSKKVAKVDKDKKEDIKIKTTTKTEVIKEVKTAEDKPANETNKKITKVKTATRTTKKAVINTNKTAKPSKESIEKTTIPPKEDKE